MNVVKEEDDRLAAAEAGTAGPAAGNASSQKAAIKDALGPDAAPPVGSAGLCAA